MTHEQQALTAVQSRVLGFESPTVDWSSSAGTLSSSATSSQGSTALAVVPAGWTEVNSIPLSTLDNVRDTLSYDVYLPSTPAWGETRAILVSPSLQMYWTDLGRQELNGLPAGQFSTVSFPLSSGLVAALSSTYSDLTIKLVINAPVLSQPYVLDNLVLTNEVGSPLPEAPEPIHTFAVRVPEGTSERDTFISATEHLSIFNGARAGVAGATPAIANFGSFTSYFQGGVRAYANIYSEAAVQLDAQVQIFGNVTTHAASIGKQGPETSDAPVVHGNELVDTPVPFDVVSWEVEWPSSEVQDVRLNAAPTQALVVTPLPPGAYGHFDVHSRNLIQLSTGTYYFTSFKTEPEAQLRLDASAGAIVVYVKQDLPSGGGLTSRAPVFADAGEPAQLLLAFEGTGEVVVQGSWQGTIVAPEATIKLERPSNPGLPGPAPSHQGAFFGKGVEVAAGEHTVQHVGFDWETFLTPPPIQWMDSPVVLRACLEADGTRVDASVAPDEAVSFTIPSTIPVSAGTAGNGTLELSFSDPGGQLVQCNYRGGSSLASPRADTDPVEWAKGMKYEFLSCGNGLQAGATVMGTEFQLRLESGDLMGFLLCAEIHLGEGCGQSLPPAIDPVLSAEIVEAFDWATTTPLPETDPDGHPALYYAWIYVETKGQIDGLNRMRVHWDTQPLFVADYHQWIGKCGSIDSAGDGNGLFVYSVIPAALYNYLRDLGLSAREDEAEMPFRAIHLPVPPDPSVLNADGSLSWDVLKANHFEYFRAQRGGFEERHQPWSLKRAWRSVRRTVNRTVGTVVGAVVDVASYAGKADEIWAGAVEIVEGIGAAITDGLGEFDKFVFGSVDVTIDLELHYTDAAFPLRTPALRARGPLKGQRLVPEGSTVWVKQWSVSIFGILPVSFHGRLGPDGKVTLEVGKNNSTRGESGLCLELENDYGMVSPFLTATEICDFRHPFPRGFRSNSTSQVKTEDYQINALSQVTEAGKFLEAAANFHPRQAEVATGWAANMVAGSANGEPQALCLDFPSAQTAALQVGVIALGGPFLGTVGSVGLSYFQKDIFLPTTSDAARRSRGVMTHEYGHYAFCNMLYDAGGGSAMGLLLARLAEGAADSRDDHLALFLESFADLIAVQVVGGSNYLSQPLREDGFLIRPPDEVGRFIKPNGMAYCVDAPCIERNFRGTIEGPGPLQEQRHTNAFSHELGRYLSLFYDVFDGPGRNHVGSEPGNGDVWMAGPDFDPSDPRLPGDRNSLLVPSQFQYSLSSLFDDERVQLDASKMQQWIRRWMERSSLLSIDIDQIVDTLVLRAIDDITTPFSQDFVPSSEDFLLLVDNVSVLPVDDFMGALTDTLVAEQINWCDTCDLYALHSPNYLDGEGQSPAERAARFAHCRADPQILWWMRSIAPPESSLRIQASTCEVCPDGQVSLEGECQLCPGDTITQGNSCVSCPLGQVANPSRTQCVACAADEIVQGGQCVSCPFGQGADATHTGCVECTVDEILDYSVVEDNICVVNAITMLESSPGDTCPELYVADVINLAPPEGELAWVWLQPSAMGVNEEQCASLTGRVSVGDPAGNIGLVNNTVAMVTTWIDPPCSEEPVDSEDPDAPEEVVLCDSSYCRGDGKVFVPAALIASFGNSLRVVASAQDTIGPLLASVGVSDTTQGSIDHRCVRVR